MKSNGPRPSALFLGPKTGLRAVLFSPLYLSGPRSFVGFSFMHCCSTSSIVSVPMYLPSVGAGSTESVPYRMRQQYDGHETAEQRLKWFLLNALTTQHVLCITYCCTSCRRTPQPTIVVHNGVNNRTYTEQRSERFY